jgi:hypothetical protein
MSATAAEAANPFSKRILARAASERQRAEIARRICARLGLDAPAPAAFAANLAEMVMEHLDAGIYCFAVDGALFADGREAMEAFCADFDDLARDPIVAIRAVRRDGEILLPKATWAGLSDDPMARALCATAIVVDLVLREGVDGLHPTFELRIDATPELERLLAPKT